jgi:hypothetical protein
MKLKKITNKRGSMLDLLVWVVICFVTIMFLGLWLYGFDKLTDALTSIDSTGSSINISKHAEATFGVINSKMNGLHAIAFIIMFSLALSILIGNFMIKAHPVFFIVYIFIVVIGMIFSVYVSNAYEDLMGHDEIGSTLQGFTGGSFIMLHLPLWVTVIGLVGAILLFAGLSRDSEFGGVGI